MCLPLWQCQGINWKFVFWPCHAACSSPTRDQTHSPCTGSLECPPLDHWGSPPDCLNYSSYKGSLKIRYWESSNFIHVWNTIFLLTPSINFGHSFSSKEQGSLNFMAAVTICSDSGTITNLDSILKSRDIALLTKVHLVRAMVFPVVMYGCESWTIKKAECQRIDAFELWCWRRLLRVPWTARRSNRSFLKEIVLNVHWKDWCWSWNSHTLTNWCEELTHLKRPDAGKDWRREKGTTEDEMVGWHHWLNEHEFE